MPIYEEETFGFFEKRKSPKRMHDVHYHNKHELYYLERGNTKYFIGSELYLLEPGDLIFVPRGAFHKTDSEESGSFERLLFTFDDDFVGEEYARYVDELKSNKHIRLPSRQLYKLTDIFRKIEKEVAHEEVDSTEMEKLYLRQILILISRYRISDNLTRLSESDAIIQSAARYISEHYDAELRLSDLSRHHAMSEGHFSRQFKKVTGIGLNEYINITRISAAEKLLLTTDMPITRVATECGFNDSNYFAAVFKKLKGITPKKYAKAFGDAEAPQGSKKTEVLYESAK